MKERKQKDKTKKGKGHDRRGSRELPHLFSQEPLKEGVNEHKKYYKRAHDFLQKFGLLPLAWACLQRALSEPSTLTPVYHFFHEDLQFQDERILINHRMYIYIYVRVYSYIIA